MHHGLIAMADNTALDGMGRTANAPSINAHVNMRAHYAETKHTMPKLVLPSSDFLPIVTPFIAGLGKINSDMRISDV